MYVQQAVPRPFGITSFGSSLIRVEPDVASLTFSISRLDKQPKKAFQLARDGSKNVQTYLAQTGVTDYGSSRITLSQTYDSHLMDRKFIGYTAEISFHLLLHDLDRVEEILIGIADAGVNNIGSVVYQTSRLKELRAEARRKAVGAAKEKAEIYCRAAGVTLGDAIHIEDVNPDQLRGREGHFRSEVPLEEDGPVKAFNPSSIVVGGTVMVAYKFHVEQNS